MRHFLLTFEEQEWPELLQSLAVIAIQALSVQYGRGVRLTDLGYFRTLAKWLEHRRSWPGSLEDLSRFPEPPSLSPERSSRGVRKSSTRAHSQPAGSRVRAAALLSEGLDQAEERLSQRRESLAAAAASVMVPASNRPALPAVRARTRLRCRSAPASPRESPRSIGATAAAGPPWPSARGCSHLQQANTCTKCGNAFLADSLFCRFCGHQREVSPPQSPASAPTLEQQLQQVRAMGQMVSPLGMESPLKAEAPQLSMEAPQLRMETSQPPHHQSQQLLPQSPLPQPSLQQPLSLSSPPQLQKQPGQQLDFRQGSSEREASRRRRIRDVQGELCSHTDAVKGPQVKHVEKGNVPDAATDEWYSTLMSRLRRLGDRSQAPVKASPDADSQQTTQALWPSGGGLSNHDAAGTVTRIGRTDSREGSARGFHGARSSSREALSAKLRELNLPPARAAPGALETAASFSNRGAPAAANAATGGLLSDLPTRHTRRECFASGARSAWCRAEEPLS